MKAKLMVLAAGVALCLFMEPSVSFAGMGGGGGGANDCNGLLVNHDHAAMCGGGGSMMGNGDPVGGTGHHRITAGSDCVPCPDSAISNQAATRVSQRNHNNTSSTTPTVKPPKSITQSGVKVGAHGASSNVDKPPLSITGGN